MEWNLILDLDGTLIEQFLYFPPAGCIPKHRPYLKEFLEYVFTHFNKVSIWTASNNEWAYPILQTFEFPEGKKFDFVLCGDGKPILKDLAIIFEAFGGYTRDNTLFIDDNVFNCNANLSNSIHVPAWFSNDDNDNILLTVMNMFKSTFPGFEDYNEDNERNIENESEINEILCKNIKSMSINHSVNISVPVDAESVPSDVFVD